MGRRERTEMGKMGGKGRSERVRGTGTGDTAARQSTVLWRGQGTGYLCLVCARLGAPGGAEAHSTMADG